MPAAKKMKVAEIRAEIARLEAVEAELLAKAEAEYYGPVAAEYAAEAYDARIAAEALAAHLPY
jgi:hypothetical protein